MDPTMRFRLLRFPPPFASHPISEVLLQVGQGHGHAGPSHGLANPGIACLLLGAASRRQPPYRSLRDGVPGAVPGSGGIGNTLLLGSKEERR